MDKDIARIRRLAGIKEAQEIIPPIKDDAEQARLDAEEDMYFDRQMAIEKVYKQKYEALYKQSGLRFHVDEINVDIDLKTGQIEIDVDTGDVEVSMSVLAKLSEIGAITLESKVKSFGNSITISTVLKLSPQEFQQLQRPQR